LGSVTAAGVNALQAGE